MPALKNAKRERFCREYVKDTNGHQAAIRAGYSKKTARAQASRLLTDVNVKARVRELTKKINDQTQVDAIWIREQLVRVHELATAERPVFNSEGEEIGTRIENLPAANKSLELLGKLTTVQAFKENIQVTRRVRVIDLTGDGTDE